MSKLHSLSPEVIERLKSPQRLLIDGHWRDASDRGTSDVFNPSDGEVITTAAAASPDDTDRAVVAARRTFDNGDWTGLT